ncbi:MAG: hypothetical protein QXH80_01525 [Candidatus Nanoarchaeia archaeon]
MLYEPDQFYVSERVSQEIIARSGGDSFASAEAYVRGSIRTIPEAKRTEFALYPKGSAERRRAENRVRPELNRVEREALWDWALKHNKVANYQKLNQIKLRQIQQGLHDGGGAEHEIAYDREGNRWWKVNFLFLHFDPLEYFNRIIIHNFLFGDYAPMRFEGVAKDDNGEIGIVITQPHIKAFRGATQKEVTDCMTRFGFKLAFVGNEFYFIHESTGIIIEDTHPANVVVIGKSPLRLAFIDPFIVLDIESKMRRLAERKREQKKQKMKRLAL